MPALDSVMLKADLLGDLGGAYYRRYLNKWYEPARDAAVENEAGMNPARVVPLTQDRDGRPIPLSAAAQGLVPDTPDQFRRQLDRWLQMAHNYYVTPEMAVLVTAAAESWEEDEPVKADDFPTQQGWLWVPGGVTEIDARGVPMPTSAILWNILGEVLTLIYFVDKNHPLDRVKQSRDETQGGWPSSDWNFLPRLTPWATIRQQLGKPVTKSLTLGVVVPPEIADQIQIEVQPHQTTYSFPKGFDQTALTPEMRPDATSVWLVSCLRLMQQPLTTVTDQGIPGNVRRSLKGKVRLRNTRLSVIEYRRRVSVYPKDESGREYSHRFLRRGHWRQQPYKDAAGEWDRKRIWIHPTIVGDESLPLLLRDHVNALVR